MRCRDSEETRKFYEHFLGLKLAEALEIGETKTRRKTETLHTFYEMSDGSYLALFEVPDRPFEFKPQHDFDLHTALEVDEAMLQRMFEKGKAQGIETRGIVDHGLLNSIYFRDPNGYVVELTAKKAGHAAAMDPALNNARAKLDRWQAGNDSGFIFPAAEFSPAPGQDRLRLWRRFPILHDFHQGAIERSFSSARHAAYASASMMSSRSR